jgi:UDP-glucose:(heptosyl)LPS alpha-1,3-glucosyltransferase
VKIGLVILHADASRGGAERYTIDVAHALAGRGHAVTLIASDFAGEISPQVGRVQSTLSARSKTRRYTQYLDQLDAHLQANVYDVVHAMLPVRQCDVYHPHAGLAVAAVETGHEKHAGVKRAVAKLFNRFNPKRQKFAAIERGLLESQNRPITICLSDYIRRDVQRYYTLKESDLATLFNAVDLQRFDPSARPDERQKAREQLSLRPKQVAGLMIANDFERKGLREAIEATARVKENRLKLIAMGKQGPGPYVQLAESLGLRMIFCGPFDDVYPFYAGADFFVLPTKHDPCSLVVLEALAMGLPVISTKQNGATEIMEHGVHGFVLENASRIDELADAMKQLCDPDTRQRMSVACLGLRERLSFERHIDRLLAIYENASERRTVKQP